MKPEELERLADTLTRDIIRLGDYDYSIEDVVKIVTVPALQQAVDVQREEDAGHADYYAANSLTASYIAKDIRAGKQTVQEERVPDEA